MYKGATFCHIHLSICTVYRYCIHLIIGVDSTESCQAAEHSLLEFTNGRSWVSLHSNIACSKKVPNITFWNLVQICRFSVILRSRTAQHGLTFCRTRLGSFSWMSPCWPRFVDQNPSSALFPGWGSHQSVILDCCLSEQSSGFLVGNEIPFKWKLQKSKVISVWDRTEALPFDHKDRFQNAGCLIH